MDDDVEHETLGVFRLSGDEGWIGRSGPGADFFDLFIMRSDQSAVERALALLAGAVAEIDALKRQAVVQICVARTERLNWRAGPAVEQWSVIEARVDCGGVLWLTLHEYETDEYSRWLVQMHPAPAEPHVRRIPALELKGDPEAAGVRV